MLRRIAPFAILILLVCLILWPVIFQGRVLLPGDMLFEMPPWNAQAETQDAAWDALTWDSIAFFYPARMMLGEALRSGELPLWNPYQMCGTPFLANFQAAALYPPNLLFAVFSTEKTFGILTAIHLLAAGIFTFIFLRSLGLSRIPSVFGGAAFMLSGFSITWLHLPVFLSSGVWLPLALYLVKISYDRKSIAYSALAGITIALSILGGHPQIAFYVMLAVGLFWLYLVIAGKNRLSVWKNSGLAVITFAIGFALAAPQLLPSMELSALSHRGGAIPSAEGYSAYSRLAMPWIYFITILIPEALGKPFHEYCGYVGMLPILLAFFAFKIKDDGRNYAWFFAILGALALMMAIGTAVNRLFYFGIPGFANSGSPARALFLFMFAISILGAMGFDRILKTDSKRLTGILLPGLLLLGIAWIFMDMIVNPLRNEMSSMGMAMSQPGFEIFAGILLAGMIIASLIVLGKLNARFGGLIITGLLAVDLLIFGMWYNPTSRPDEVYPETKLTQALRTDDFSRIMPLNDRWSLSKFPNAVLPPNTSAAYGLFDVQGYDALYPLRYKSLLNAAGESDSSPLENGNMVFARNPDSPIYDLLGVRFIISNSPIKAEGKEIDGCYVYENSDAFPRAFIAREIAHANDEEALRLIAEGGVDLSKTVLIEPTYEFSATGSADGDKVRIREYTFNRVTLDVETDSPGILVLTDQYYPGWKAYVDDAPKEILKANYAFRAAPIKAGKQTVIFSYEPESFKKGLILAKIASIFLVGIIIHAILRKRFSAQ